MVFGGVVIVFLLQFVIPRDMVAAVKLGFLWGCAVIAMSGALAAFLAAGRLQLVSRETILLAILLWAAESTVCWWLLPLDVVYSAAVIGLLTLSVTPLAAAPLAIWWNRHR